MGEGIKEKDIMKLASFGRRMTERFKKVKKPNGWYYKGIGIKNLRDDPKESVLS